MTRKRERKSRRTRGEIGSTRITASKSGTEAKVVSAYLPSNKEELESCFAELFVGAFNRDLPFGDAVTLSITQQNDTSDLDFLINCPVADHLELAELTPLDTAFGRSALQTGVLRPYDYAKWTYHKIIRHKANRYGSDVARKTLLLLYFTHWQFLPSDKMIACLQSFCIHRPVDFAGIFLMRTNGSDLALIELISPFATEPRPVPVAYKNEPPYINPPPGQASWSFDLANMPPDYSEADAA